MKSFIGTVEDIHHSNSDGNDNSSDEERSSNYTDDIKFIVTDETTAGTGMVYS